MPPRFHGGHFALHFEMCHLVLRSVKIVPLDTLINVFLHIILTEKKYFHFCK